MDFFRNPALRIDSDLDRHALIRRPLDPGSPIETDTGKSEHIFQGEIDVARFPYWETGLGVSTINEFILRVDF